MNVMARAVMAVLLAAMAAGTALAQPAQSQASAAADIVRGITMTNTGDLEFGGLLAGTGGTVVITAAGVRTTGGGLVALSAPFSPASFFVNDIENRGNRKFTFAILTPTIQLTRVSGTETMTVSAFTHDARACQPCEKTPATVKVGATLTVGNNQMPGTYVGTFSVRVDEQ